MIELTGADESLIEYVTDRPGHDRRYSLASEKLTDELGWEAEVHFAEGLERPSTGTATTRSGGGRSAPASTASTTSGSTAGRWGEVCGFGAPGPLRWRFEAPVRSVEAGMGVPALDATAASKGGRVGRPLGKRGGGGISGVLGEDLSWLSTYRSSGDGKWTTDEIWRSSVR